MKHELTDGTLKIEGDKEKTFGIVGRCTCGWNTGYRITAAVASIAFENHQEEMERKEKTK